MIAYIVAGALLAPDVLANVPSCRYSSHMFGICSKTAIACGCQSSGGHKQMCRTRSPGAISSDCTVTWAGTIFIANILVEPAHTHILLDGDIAVGRLPRPLEIELFVDGQLLRRQRIGRKKRFSLRLPLNAIAPGDHELKIVSNVYSVPNKFLANGDFRPLSFRVTTTYIDNRQVKNEDNERNISWRQRAWQV
jgi:hypothetical protein